MVHLTSKTQGMSKRHSLCFYFSYKILTTFKLAVIAPAMVVTCPTPNGPFCNTNVELALVTFTRSVLEMAGSITTVDVVTLCIKLPAS